MSTRSHIGIKIGDKVKYIYCHSDGYLSYNGVYLNLFLSVYIDQHIQLVIFVDL